ncbi:MAG: hypothetical protein EOP39_17800 [Rubrivivax sp.]|nr:MAG: hypothetical protein EOP39_17800 [Rubrivivax sp.]
MKRRPLTRLHLTVLACALTGCAVAPIPVAPIEFKRTPPSSQTGAGPASDERSSTEFVRLPSYGKPATRNTEARPAAAPESSPAPSPDEEVSIAIEQTPLPMFIQILYGNVLKRPYSIDAAVQARTDPVTFKTSKPISKQRMNELAATLLRSYRLTVQDLDGLVKIGPETPPGQNADPRILQGRLPSNVSNFSSIFYFIELDAVRTVDVTPWLRQVMGSRIVVTEDGTRNGLLISGNAGDVRAALALVESFDQPRMRGRVTMRITPVYATATDLAQRLVEVLTTQGISAGTTSNAPTATVVLMPVPSVSSIYVFTTNQAMLDNVRQWARELDRAPRQSAGAGLFTYPVKYADAQELARTLGELLGGGSGGSAPASSNSPPSGTGSQTRATSFGRVVVNNATNTLIIRGSSAEEQQQVKDLLRELDRPTKSAMIEVVVAELREGASAELGIDWKSSNSPVSGTSTRSVTAGPAGLNIAYVNTARDLLANINALASNSEARVLSNPRVLARNGETATIQVGSEVPVVTSQQSTASGGLFPSQNGLLQQIQYRSTGVILKVRPVINSGNRLDLDVSQEVSNASTTQTGVSASPTISTRRIETKLSLRDGSTVLLGGLISQDGNVSDSGVPLLKDIPLLGALFKKQGKDSNRTELLVMITPHVVNDDFEAEEISAAMRDSFGTWAQDLKLSRVTHEPPAPTEQMPAGTGKVNREEDVQPLPPLAEPASLSTSNPSSAPAPKPAAQVPSADEGVELSKPGTAPTGASTAPAPATPTGEPAKTADPKKPATPPKPAAPGAVPPGMKGEQVTDPKVLEEIKKLMDRR